MNHAHHCSLAVIQFSMPSESLIPDMGVSWNGGAPKSSMFMGFSLTNQAAGIPIYGKPHLEVQLHQHPAPLIGAGAFKMAMAALYPSMMATKSWKAAGRFTFTSVFFSDQKTSGADQLWNHGVSQKIGSTRLTNIKWWNPPENCGFAGKPSLRTTDWGGHHLIELPVTTIKGPMVFQETLEIVTSAMSTHQRLRLAMGS